MLHKTTKLVEKYPYLSEASVFCLAPDMERLHRLTENERAEALEFLASQPVHTVVMASFINDNGLESKANRGSFFGYRNESGQLEGLALIGHATLIEARTDEAVRAFAIAASRSDVKIKLIMSAGDGAERFWKFFANSGNSPTHTFEEILFQASFPFAVQRCDEEIRLATRSELDQVAAAQAEVAFGETGIDPMVQDREGFLERVGDRIDKGRVYVAMREGKLAFKADVMAEANDVCYIEGVYVNEAYRGQGIGSACLSRVCVELFGRVTHVSMLSNSEFGSAHKSFERAGFKRTGSCTTLFV